MKHQFFLPVLPVVRVHFGVTLDHFPESFFVRFIVVNGLLQSFFVLLALVLKNRILLRNALQVPFESLVLLLELGQPLIAFFHVWSLPLARLERIRRFFRLQLLAHTFVGGEFFHHRVGQGHAQTRGQDGELRD